MWQAMIEQYQQQFKLPGTGTDTFEINIVFIELALFYDNIQIMNLGQRLFNNFNSKSKEILHYLKNTVIAKGQASIGMNTLVIEF
jgi:hypothetical protein